MLRFETQKTGEVEIIHNGEVMATYPTYANTIKEPITHFPTGHYVSLVSAYTPLKYNDVGQFSIMVGEHCFVKHDGGLPIKSFNDLVDRISTNMSKLEVADNGKIKITLIIPNGEEQAEPQRFKLVLSVSAAWFLGFKNTTTRFTHMEDNYKRYIVYSDFKYPPATIRYLQVICKNACGTTDSNMTMPTTMGIMHVTDDLTLINPHIAVNHRIEKGRIIDIEILDQNDQPFTWGPVYLELFVSEGAEHEKKQGFFRFEKSHAVHLHAPVKMISVPNVFAVEPARILNCFTVSCAQLIMGVNVKTFMPKDDEYCKKLEGLALTRSTVIKIFERMNDFFKKAYKNIIKADPSTYDFFKASIDQTGIHIKVYIGTLKMNDILQIYKDQNVDQFKDYVASRHETITFRVDPNYWHNDDARLNIYCKEYHDRIPVAVARRIDNYYQIVNRVFWAWHEFEKAANELHFRVDRVITYPDGSVSCEPWPANKELLLQLFYK